MRIPLAGFEVCVAVVDNLKCPESRESLYGLYHDLEIKLDSGCQPSRRLETFLHEYTHAISDSFGLDLSEAQVQTLGMMLHHGLKDYLGELQSHLAAL